MNLLRTLFYFVLTLSALASVDCSSGDGSPSSLDVNVPAAQSAGDAAAQATMQNLILPGSRWGGAGANLLINGGGGTLQLACAQGQLLQTISLDANNRFEVSGIYFDEKTRRSHPAQFIGRIDGHSMIMAFSVLLTDTFKDQTVAAFDMTYSRFSNIQRCSFR